MEVTITLSEAAAKRLEAAAEAAGTTPTAFASALVTVHLGGFEEAKEEADEAVAAGLVSGVEPVRGYMPAPRGYLLEGEG